MIHTCTCIHRRMNLRTQTVLAVHSSGTRAPMRVVLNAGTREGIARGKVPKCSYAVKNETTIIPGYFFKLKTKAEANVNSYA